MASYFTLNLDTTPPIIEIIAPPYNHIYDYFNITIQSNEALSAYQEIYFISPSNMRIDCIFKHEGDKFVGVVSLNEKGIYTLYATLKDEVLNESIKVSQQILLISPKILLIIPHEEIMGMTTSEVTRDISLSELTMNVSTEESTREISLHEDIMTLDCIIRSN